MSSSSFTPHGVVTANRKHALSSPHHQPADSADSLAPKYEELGTLFAPFSDKVSITKVDATANDVPDEIAGFPTIKLFAAGKKDSPIDYTGARTVEDLAAFVRDNGSNKIDIDLDFNAEGDVEMSDAAAKKTEEMQHQAPAATEKGAAAKVTDAAKKIVEVASGGDDDNMDDHDEL